MGSNPIGLIFRFLLRFLLRLILLIFGYFCPWVRYSPQQLLRYVAKKLLFSKNGVSFKTLCMSHATIYRS